MACRSWRMASTRVLRLGGLFEDRVRRTERPAADEPFSARQREQPSQPERRHERGRRLIGRAVEQREWQGNEAHDRDGEDDGIQTNHPAPMFVDALTTDGDEASRSEINER